MKKLNDTEMRSVDGGAKVHYVANCTLCGTCYRATATYWSWIPGAKKRALDRAIIKACSDVKRCENRDVLKW